MDTLASRAPRRRPGFGLGLGLGLLGLIFGLSFAFATASQTQQYAADADLVQASDQVMNLSAITRADIGVVLVLAQAEADGAAVANMQQSLAQLEITVGELSSRSDVWMRFASDDAVPTIRTATRVIESELAPFTTAIEEEKPAVAESLAVSQLLPSLDLINATVTEERDNGAARLAALRTSAGTLARLASLGVALLLPAIGFVMMRVGFRRRQRQEKLLAELQRERHAVKTKDDFINSLSHELRTPLTSIFGFAVIMDDLLDSGAPPDAGLFGESTKVILSEAAELNRMVDDLLTHAKKKSGVFHLVQEEASIATIVDQSIDVFRRQGIDIDMHCEDMTLVVDTHHVTQMVRNLVSNAVKHGGPGISIRGTGRDDHYSISVMDDGPGVPPDLAERLFTRFVHQEEAPLTTGSVGLGLFICKTLAEEMGGDLTYGRVDDKTIFTVSLPLSAEGAQVDETLSEAGTTTWIEDEPEAA